MLGAADEHGSAPDDDDAARLDAARRELTDAGIATAETLASFDTGITRGLLR